MRYGWIIGGLAALDLGIKNEIERQEADTFPRELPGSKGKIVLHQFHNDGFPFGFLRQYPQVVKQVPLLMVSAAAGALAAFSTRKDGLPEKLGLSLVLGGAISNLYDRLKRGYVVDYFSIRIRRLERVIFNLGDLFIFAGGLLLTVAQLVRELREGKQKR